MRVGIVLAAGRSSRFGQDKRRVRLPNGKTMPECVIEALAPVCDRVLLVLNPQDAVHPPVLRGSGFHCVYADDAEQGMGCSLASAVRSLAAGDDVLLTLADKPFIRAETYQQVAHLMRHDRICVPVCRAQRGHPVGFGSDWREALCLLSGDEGARTLIASQPAAVLDINCEDDGVLEDVDTPEAMVRLTQRFGIGPPATK